MNTPKTGVIDPPFDRLSSSLSDLPSTSRLWRETKCGVEDRVVSPSTSFRINRVEPPMAGRYQ
jgi:hypothetical protein